VSVCPSAVGGNCSGEMNMYLNAWALSRAILPMWLLLMVQHVGFAAGGSGLATCSSFRELVDGGAWCTLGNRYTWCPSTPQCKSLSTPPLGRGSLGSTVAGGARPLWRRTPAAIWAIGDSQARLLAESFLKMWCTKGVQEGQEKHNCGTTGAISNCTCTEREFFNASKNSREVCNEASPMAYSRVFECSHGGEVGYGLSLHVRDTRLTDGEDDNTTQKVMLRFLAQRVRHHREALILLNAGLHDTKGSFSVLSGLPAHPWVDPSLLVAGGASVLGEAPGNLPHTDMVRMLNDRTTMR